MAYKISSYKPGYFFSKLVKNEPIKGLPHIAFKNEKLCDVYQIGKQVKTSFKSKHHISIERPLEWLHVDLFRPTRARSINGYRYMFVIIDDFTRYIWVLFLKLKDETIFEFVKFSKNKHKEWLWWWIYKWFFEMFCEEKGYHHNFSTRRTP